MATRNLDGCTVAALVTDMFEQVELTRPLECLREAGAEVRIVSPKDGQVQGFDHFDKADTFPVDIPLDRAEPGDFDALLLPGGVGNPDQLRMDERAVAFARAFVQDGKPIAAICHGPWLLVEADAVQSRRLTSWPSLRTDIRNAGGEWVDEEVVVDEGIVTSRGPQDLDAFCDKLLEEFAEGVHPRSGTAAGTGGL